MKKLIFIITIVFLCLSCINKKDKHETVSDSTINNKEVAIKKLQDSTITSVYLGLQLGMEKDSAICFLKELQKKEKITDLQVTSLSDDIRYRCTGIVYHNDSYMFSSKLNIAIDSAFYAFDTYCFVDFYKNKLSSIMSIIHPFVLSKIDSEQGWDEINKIYINKYGIGFTSKSTFELSKTEPIVSEWTHDINDIVSYTTDNTIWTTANIQVILATTKTKINVDEYDKESFYKIYNKYGSKDLAYQLKRQVIPIKSYYKYVNHYSIVYNDIKLHTEYINEINRIQQVAIEEKERLKAEETRKKEIDDSIKQEKIKKEYANQSI